MLAARADTGRQGMLYQYFSSLLAPTVLVYVSCCGLCHCSSHLLLKSVSLSKIIMPDPFSAIGTVGLWGYGFTKGGVAAKSFAAGTHAMVSKTKLNLVYYILYLLMPADLISFQIGSVSKGSLFALAQSAGATGAAAGFGVAIVGVGIGVGVATYAGYKYYYST